MIKNRQKIATIARVFLPSERILQARKAILKLRPDKLPKGVSD